jgi:hypothetical protein
MDVRDRGIENGEWINILSTVSMTGFYEQGKGQVL